MQGFPQGFTWHRHKLSWVTSLPVGFGTEVNDNVVHDKLFTPCFIRPEHPNAKIQHGALLTPASPNSAGQDPAEAGGGLGIFRPAPFTAPFAANGLGLYTTDLCQ